MNRTVAVRDFELKKIDRKFGHQSALEVEIVMRAETDVRPSLLSLVSTLTYCIRVIS